MMLVAGQTWRAALLLRGALTRTLLTAVPPRRVARPGDPPPSRPVFANLRWTAATSPGCHPPG